MWVVSRVIWQDEKYFRYIMLMYIFDILLYSVYCIFVTVQLSSTVFIVMQRGMHYQLTTCITV